jgi:hypothetical protein
MPKIILERSPKPILIDPKLTQMANDKTNATASTIINTRDR